MGDFAGGIALSGDVWAMLVCYIVCPRGGKLRGGSDRFSGCGATYLATYCGCARIQLTGNVTD